MRAGNPVCSERPLGLAISDARGLRALAAETKVPTTYRSPGTATGQFRRAIELVQDGAVGQVQEVHVWFKRGGPDRNELPQGTQAVPEGLDWDLWLGPLPRRDYHPDWMTYAHWRETCNGGLGGFGPHTAIFPFMILGLRELWDTVGVRIHVQAECSWLNRISFPRWERVRWEIPARKDMPPVTITWQHCHAVPRGNAALRPGSRANHQSDQSEPADGVEVSRWLEDMTMSVTEGVGNSPRPFGGVEPAAAVLYAGHPHVSIHCTPNENLPPNLSGSSLACRRARAGPSTPGIAGLHGWRVSPSGEAGDVMGSFTKPSRHWRARGQFSAGFCHTARSHSLTVRS